MMRMLSMIAAAAVLTFAASASASQNGTKEEAVAMVKRVEAMFAKDGADATFKAVSDKSVVQFHDRDLYPFIYDMRGTALRTARGRR